MRIFLMSLSLLALIFAFSEGCREKSRKKGADADNPAAGNAVTSGTITSIHEAALNGSSAEVDRLLALGVDADSTDADGRSPIMYASFNGYAGIIGTLILHGASVNRCDSFGRTALMFASSGPYPEAVKILLKHQADPNIADREEHFTALMYAASEGQAEVVRLLLTSGADPALKDIDGDDALTFARNNNHQEVVNIIERFVK